MTMRTELPYRLRPPATSQATRCARPCWRRDLGDAAQAMQAYTAAVAAALTSIR